MVLEQLMIDCDGMSYVTFEAGAMPSLWMLSLGIDPDEWDKDTAIPDGLQHLSGLKEICVLEANTVGPDRRKDNTSTMERIKGAFQEAAGVHPRIMVSASMGVMKPLLTKLVTLMGDKYKKLKGVQKEVLFLKDELGTMNALLEKMDDIDELDPLAKNWRKHVVDMAYDIEDCIDDFMHRVCEAEGKVGILQKASHCLKTFKDHYLIANEIQKIKIRVIEASERRWRYKLYDFISNTTLVAVDPRILALYKETASLVGIDTPKKEVIKLLRDEGQQLIVVPIIGFGGLGKTTLANEVYREIGGQFNCKAFVAASQKPNITTLLNSLLSQFNLNPPSHAHEAQDLINMLRAYLQDKRDELVRRWVAEGFVTVSASHRGDEWDVAMSYFNELVNRSMIQPVYDCYNVEVVSCRLHDMMLDLIVRRCREYNFVSLVHDPGAVVELQDKVRRLTANLNGAEMPVIISNCSHLSQIRSLAILERSYWAPPLLEFKRLRVLLLLEFPKNIKRIDLTCISQLSQLRYLKVQFKTRPQLDYSQTHHIVLPSQIRNMRKLETLEIPFEVFSSIPSDIVDLPCLANLIMPWDLLLPDGIGKLTSLRTLKSFRVWMSSSETIEGIGKLTNLTDLSLERCRKLVGPTGRCADDHTTTATWMTALTSSLEKLVRLKRLSLESFPAGCCACSDGLSSLTPNIGNLEWLDVSEWTFYRVPRWIGDLHNLRSLRLTVKEMSKSSWEDDSIIGKLPSLILLNLKITGVLTERIVIGGSTGFALLRRFEFNYDGTSHLRFESGAMPKLRELMLRLDPWAWDKATPVGLHHLSSLMEINVHTLELRDSTTGGSGESGQKIMNSVFSKAAAAIPSRPAVAVWCG
nr:unnamed protein product [Digitaria exilis]